MANIQINNKTGIFELWIDGKNVSKDIVRAELILDTEKATTLRVEYIVNTMEAKLEDKILRVKKRD